MLVLGTGVASPGNGSSRSISIREMMQKAVLAARANLEVDDEAAIPTLHWPPDPAPSTAATTPATATVAATPATNTPPTGW